MRHSVRHLNQTIETPCAGLKWVHLPPPVGVKGWETWCPLRMSWSHLSRYSLACNVQKNRFGPLKVNPKHFDLSWGLHSIRALDKFTPRLGKGSPSGLLLNLRCHHVETSNLEASARHRPPSRERPESQRPVFSPGWAPGRRDKPAVPTRGVAGSRSKVRQICPCCRSLRSRRSSLTPYLHLLPR